MADIAGFQDNSNVASQGLRTADRDFYTQDIDYFSAEHLPNFIKYLKVVDAFFQPVYPDMRWRMLAPLNGLLFSKWSVWAPVRG